MVASLTNFTCGMKGRGGLVPDRIAQRSTVGLAFDDIVTLPYAWQMAFFTSFLTPLRTTRNANVGTERATEYCVDPDNGNNGGSGLEEEPWQTLAPVATLLAGNPTNIRIRLRRGFTYAFSAIQNLTFRSHSTFDDWSPQEGDAEAEDPIVSSFDFWASASGAGGWTSVGGGVHWKSTGGAGTEPVWVRHKGTADGTGTVLTRASDTTALAALTNGFYRDTTNHRVYVRLGGGATDPNTVNLDGCNGYDGNGILAFGGDIRISRIELQGVAMRPDAAGQTYTLSAQPQADTDEIVVEGVKGIFGGYHIFGQNGGATKKGIVTWIDCSGGYMRPYDGAGILVSHGEVGDQETYVKNFTSLAGNLFDQTAHGATSRIAESIYCHTAGGAAKLKLFIVEGHTIVSGAMAVRTGAGGVDLPDVAITPYDWFHADWLLSRGFIIDEVLDDHTISTTHHTVINGCPNNFIRINSQFKTAPDSGGATSFGYRGTGVTINNYYHSEDNAFRSMWDPVADGGWDINPHYRYHSYGCVNIRAQDANTIPNMSIVSGIVECLAPSLPDYPYTSSLNCSISSNKVRYSLLTLTNPTVDNALTIPNGTAGDGNLSTMTGNTIVNPVGSTPKTPLAAATGNLVGTGDPASQLEYDYFRNARVTKDRGPVAA